jgi:signal transduction histidine kinase
MINLNFVFGGRILVDAKRKYILIDNWLVKAKKLTYHMLEKEEVFLAGIITIYILTSIFWVQTSDYFLISIIKDYTNEYQKIKEYMFILFTLTFFYVFIKKYLKNKYSKIRMEIQQIAENGRVKNDILSNINHEFRTLINIIVGTVQLIDFKNNNGNGCINKEDINRYTSTIKQNCYRLLKLVNNQLDINRIDAGYLSLNLQPHNIIDIIENITVSVLQYAEDNFISLEFFSEVKEKIMLCDAEKVERIMLNLLSNAIKYTDPGGCIWVKVFDKGGKIVISVKDTGIGIPKDKHNEIFEKFTRVNSSKIMKHEGSGIGLFLVKKFVELHKGRICVESEIGKGSEFNIELPILNNLSEFNKITRFNMLDEDIKRVNIEFSDLSK